ncbi:MAG: redox-regulated ATPase YchF [Thermoanaerobaculia bacterium]
MQLGILGLQKAGKTTLFNTLTASHEATGKFLASDATHLGVAKVPDPRLAALRDLFHPKKYTPATVEYVDIPGLTKGEGAESLDLAKLKTVDALLHVVRAFEDAEIAHPDGGVDPLRDVHTIDLELILSDHTLIERRLDRLEKAAKRGPSAEDEREKKLLKEIILPALEAERPVRALTLEADDERLLRGYQLLTAKPMLVVLNVGESAVASATPKDYGLDTAKHPAIVVSAPIEEEISRLSDAEQKEFLGDLGLTEPSLDRVLRASFELLGRIAFFTVGEDEVRAWTIRRGIHAKEAAGTIHSDIERGFIRAEVVACAALLEHKTLAHCRDKGLLRLEGKEYIVLDGDVINFRFNV